MFEMISDFLKTQDVKYAFGASLRDMSTIKIGGQVSCLVYPRTAESYKRLLRYLTVEKVPYKILGRMSNILFVRESYNIVAVKTDLMKSYAVSDNVLEAECGVVLASVSLKLAREGYGGISELSGIPGSLGGLIRTCGGAFGKDISDVLLSVSVYDPEKDELYDLKREDIAFSYRYCPIDEKLAIVGAKILLKPCECEKIKSEIERFRSIRKSSQPIELPSLGSTFKRPHGAYAAQLIDWTGLRGRRVGGAVISEKHAGFIVNSGGASYSDVLALMKIAKDEVFELYGIDLEPEIETF